MYEIKSDREFELLLKDSDSLLVVDYWAEWCGPCKQYGPTFKNASEEVKGASFVKVNVDKCKITSKNL